MHVPALNATSALSRRGRFLRRLVNFAVQQRQGPALAGGGLCWTPVPADFHRSTLLGGELGGLLPGLAGPDLGHYRPRRYRAPAPGRHQRKPGPGAAVRGCARGDRGQPVRRGPALWGIKALPAIEQAEQVAVPTMLGAWLLLHTLFTLRYAHVYFSEDSTASLPDKLGGLQFVGEPPARSLATGTSPTLASPSP